VVLSINIGVEYNKLVREVKTIIKVNKMGKVGLKK
jgi:hypothetical protein